MDKNVHTEHCCAKHGCKYSDTDCPVFSGKQKQSYPCEFCDDHEDGLEDRVKELEAHVRQLRATLTEASDYVRIAADEEAAVNKHRRYPRYTESRFLKQIEDVLNVPF